LSPSSISAACAEMNLLSQKSSVKYPEAVDRQ
jgi:hypothetical protein